MATASSSASTLGPPLHHLSLLSPSSLLQSSSSYRSPPPLTADPHQSPSPGLVVPPLAIAILIIGKHFTWQWWQRQRGGGGGVPVRGPPPLFSFSSVVEVYYGWHVESIMATDREECKEGEYVEKKNTQCSLFIRK